MCLNNSSTYKGGDFVKCDCGKENAQLFFKKGKMGGDEVWFKCRWCGKEWQDYCHSCQNPLELIGNDKLCAICGGQ